MKGPELLSTMLAMGAATEEERKNLERSGLLDAQDGTPEGKSSSPPAKKHKRKMQKQSRKQNRSKKKKKNKKK